MGYQQEVFSLIARLGGSKHKIVADRTLCQFMGGLEGGVFLSQLLYWSDKGNGEWFYKTHSDWYEEIFLSPYVIRRCTEKCVEIGFLETELRHGKNAKPTVHYRINMEKFVESIVKFLRLDNEIFDNGKSNFSECDNQKFDNAIIRNTETTTKTTSKTTASSSSARVEQKLTKTKDDDDDDLAYAAVRKAWIDEVPGKLTPHLEEKITALVAECGADSVIHGILVSVEAGSPHFKYIAACARNHAAAKAASPPANASPYSQPPPAEMSHKRAWRADERRNYRPPADIDPLPIFEEATEGGVP